jgi:hypothetical protein
MLSVSSNGLNNYHSVQSTVFNPAKLIEKATKLESRINESLQIMQGNLPIPKGVYGRRVHLVPDPKEKHAQSFLGVIKSDYSEKAISQGQLEVSAWEMCELFNLKTIPPALKTHWDSQEVLFQKWGGKTAAEFIDAGQYDLLLAMPNDLVHRAIISCCVIGKEDGHTGNTSLKLDATGTKIVKSAEIDCGQMMRPHNIHSGRCWWLGLAQAGQPFDRKFLEEIASWDLAELRKYHDTKRLYDKTQINAQFERMELMQKLCKKALEKEEISLTPRELFLQIFRLKESYEDCKRRGWPDFPLFALGKFPEERYVEPRGMATLHMTPSPDWNDGKNPKFNFWHRNKRDYKEVIDDATLLRLPKESSKIDLSNQYFLTDERLEQILDHFEDLQEINLTGCGLITDQAIQKLAQRHPHVQILSLDYCSRISDRAVRHLAEHCKGLKALHFSMISGRSYEEERKGKPFDYEGMNLLLKECPELEELTLKGVTLAGKKDGFYISSYNYALFKDCVCSNLKHLDISSISNNSDSYLKYNVLFEGIGRCFPNLESLDCSGNQEIKIYQDLFDGNLFPHLKHLNIQNISDTGYNDKKKNQENLNTFFEKLPPLVSLDISHNKELTDANIAAFKNTENLEKIALGDCPQLTSACLISLANRSPNLKVIDLRGSVSDQFDSRSLDLIRGRHVEVIL